MPYNNNLLSTYYIRFEYVIMDKGTLIIITSFYFSTLIQVKFCTLMKVWQDMDSLDFVLQLGGCLSIPQCLHLNTIQRNHRFTTILILLVLYGNYKTYCNTQIQGVAMK